MTLKQIYYNLRRFAAFKIAAIISLVMCTSSVFAAVATDDVSQISRNITEASEGLPGMATGLSYLLGTLLGAWAILKIKEHVDNPNQTPLRDPLSKLIVGGALFALPTITEAMLNAFTGGGAAIGPIDPNLQAGLQSVMVGNVTAGDDVNAIIGNIESSVTEVPGIITAAGYLLGLIAAIAGVLKVKEYIENPQQVQIKEPVIRFLFGGAMFALPTVYGALYGSIIGNDTSFFDFSNAMNILGTFLDTGSGVASCPAISTAGTNMSDVICNTITSAGRFPGLLMALSYLASLFLGIWGIFKIRDHVLNPNQVSIWDGLTRLLAAAAFSAIPAIMDAAFFSVNAFNTIDNLENTSGFSGTATGSGLDAMLEKFMNSTFGPMSILMNWFGIISGMILIMIAVSRLLKSTQEGPKSPIGIGTIMTFITGGLLLSFSPMMSAISASFFDDGDVATNATLAYTSGMDQAVIDHSHAVISAVLKFMMVLGIIAVARGIFIVRGVSEGNQQASIMAGLTHMIGGVFAINLGPLMNAVQDTLGLTSYGVTFN